MLYLEDGKPLRFGKNREHGIRLNGFSPEVVENVASDDGLLVHDTKADVTLANILVGMDYPDFPVPIGVFRDADAPSFETLVAEQVTNARAKGEGDFEALLHSGETWEVS
jgi:2-oxoglutarate ferredoxin oxidoreductase subunit beta